MPKNGDIHDRVLTESAEYLSQFPQMCAFRVGVAHDFVRD